MSSTQTVREAAQEAFDGIAQILRLAGMWPAASRNPCVRVLHDLRRCFHMLATCFIVATGVAKSNAEAESVTDFFVDVALVFAVMQVLPLMVFLTLSAPLLVDLVGDILRLQDGIYDGARRRDVPTVASFNRFRRVFRVAYGAVSLQAYLLSVYYGYFKGTPIFNAYYPIEREGVQLALTLILEIFQIYYLLASHFGFLAIFILLTEILSGSLDQLKSSLLSLDSAVELSERDTDWVEHQVILRRLFADWIQRHQEMYRLLRRVEDTFTYAFMIFIPVNVLSVCLATFLMITVPDIRHILAGSTLSLVGNIILCCIFANKLSEKTTTLREAAYACNWYDYNQDLKKTVQILMSRCDSRFVLTVGKVVPLDVHTMVKILQETMAYILVMLNVSDINN